MVNIDGGRWLRMGEGEAMERETEWRALRVALANSGGTNGQNRKKWRRGQNDTTDERIYAL